MTDAQLTTVVIVYATAIVPMLLLGVLHRRGRIDRWLVTVYAAALVFSATGWEIWLTYGLVDGQAVDLRRAAALSAAIPQHANWLVNSLADAAICMFGLLLVACADRFRLAPFLDWNWGAFALLFTWFIGQNILAELTI